MITNVMAGPALVAAVMTARSRNFEGEKVYYLKSWKFHVTPGTTECSCTVADIFQIESNESI